MNLRKRTNIISISYLTFSVIFSIIMYARHLEPFYLLYITAVTGPFFCIYLITRKCPKCKKSLIINPIKIFGDEIFFPTFYVPKKCSECGYDLEKYDK